MKRGSQSASSKTEESARAHRRDAKAGRQVRATTCSGKTPAKVTYEPTTKNNRRGNQRDGGKQIEDVLSLPLKIAG
jgi:hypothetical protein